MNMPNIHKVVFVVDRKDLDYQTTKEFNSFSAGSIDGTDNTGARAAIFGQYEPDRHDNSKAEHCDLKKVSSGQNGTAQR